MAAKKPAGLWIKVFRLGGIGIYVDPLVVALLALVFLAGESADAMDVRLLQLGIVLGSVFVHELAHVLMARRRGLAASGIFLHVMPFAYVERGKPEDELRVALAGPAMNLLIAGLLLALPGGSPPAARARPPLHADPRARARQRRAPVVPPPGPRAPGGAPRRSPPGHRRGGRTGARARKPRHTGQDGRGSCAPS